MHHYGSRAVRVPPDAEGVSGQNVMVVNALLTPERRALAVRPTITVQHQTLSAAVVPAARPKTGLAVGLLGAFARAPRASMFRHAREFVFPLEAGTHELVPDLAY